MLHTDPSEEPFTKLPINPLTLWEPSAQEKPPCGRKRAESEVGVCSGNGIEVTAMY